MTLERVRADVADILGIDRADVLDTDNLIDFGLDSIRIMALAERWREAGAAVPFASLAERPEIEHWWRLISDRLREA
jgi:bifunctional isochorismate lyase/aryl carrier protein